MNNGYDNQSPLDFGLTGMNISSPTVTPKKFSGSGLESKKLSCPNCGDSLEIKSTNSKSATCPSCGSTIDLSNNDILGKNISKSALPWSHIKLGMTGKFKGIEYQVVGRVRFQSPQGFFWDEWMLITRKGKICWLSEDEGKFFLLEPFVPTGEVDLDKVWAGDRFVQWDGAKSLVFEKGKAEIVFVEGELSWKPKIGEEIKFIDAKRGNTKLSCEIEEDEIKFFKGIYYSPKLVYSSFNIKNRIPPIPLDDDDDDDDDDELTMNWDSVPKPVKEFMPIALIAGLIFLLIGAMFSSNGKIIKTSFIGNKVSNINDFIDSPVFKLKNKGGTYAIRGYASIPTVNNWTWSQVILMKVEDNKKLTPKIIFEKEYWYEDGYDEGEYWNEADLDHYEYFVLDKPGNYKLRLYAENSGIHKNNAVYAEVREGVIRRTYITYFGLFLIILSVVSLFLTIFIYQERSDEW